MTGLPIIRLAADSAMHTNSLDIEYEGHVLMGSWTILFTGNFDLNLSIAANLKYEAEWHTYEDYGTTKTPNMWWEKAESVSIVREICRCAPQNALFSSRRDMMHG